MTAAAAGYWCPVPSGRSALHAGRAGVTRRGKRLMEQWLFLWQRVGAVSLVVRGDAALLDRYFVLVPPI